MPRVTKEPKIDLQYARDLEGILVFKNFSSTEETLRKLEELRQRFQQAGDKTGVSHCRRVALQGRLRAELISRNPRVAPRKRLQKKELANWFKIWLETPDLFQDWLALRKESSEFKELLESTSAQKTPSDVHFYGSRT